MILVDLFQLSLNSLDCCHIQHLECSGDGSFLLGRGFSRHCSKIVLSFEAMEPMIGWLEARLQQQCRKSLARVDALVPKCRLDGMAAECRPDGSSVGYHYDWTCSYVFLRDGMLRVFRASKFVSSLAQKMSTWLTIWERFLPLLTSAISWRTEIDSSLACLTVFDWSETQHSKPAA